MTPSEWPWWGLAAFIGVGEIHHPSTRVSVVPISHNLTEWSAVPVGPGGVCLPGDLVCILGNEQAQPGGPSGQRGTALDIEKCRRLFPAGAGMNREHAPPTRPR